MEAGANRGTQAISVLTCPRVRALAYKPALARAVLAADRAHEGTGMSREAHDILQILLQHGDGVSEAELVGVAQAIYGLYSSDETAPPYWQDKNQLRKQLRQGVRRLVKDLELTDRGRVAASVDAYAVEHLRKP